jgi:hypothetical protein
METTTEFINRLGSADLHSFILCLQAYNERASIRGEEIEHIGYNNQTGHVFIDLENSISIVSCFGRDVNYMTTNLESGEETFHDTYEQALDSVNQ